MSNLSELLDERIRKEFEDLDLTLPDENNAARLNRLISLYELKIKERELEEQIRNRQEDAEEKKQSTNKDRIIKAIIDGSAIIIPAAIGWIWMGRGLKFEETGTYSARTPQWVSSIQRFFRRG